MSMRGASLRLISALCLLIPVIPSSVSAKISVVGDQTLSTVLRATQIVAGTAHTCALTNTGDVMCWGASWYGLMGDGTISNRVVPTVVRGLSNVAALSAGQFHTCALLGDGVVRCWGGNQAGQLGAGSATAISSTMPLTVSMPLSNAIAIAAGTDHTCAVLSTGGAMCWGGNAYGQLGNGTYMSSTVPVSVDGVSDAAAIATGEQRTCVALHTGNVLCWGRNWGNTPMIVSGVSDATSIAVGNGHACARTSTGLVMCWGLNEYGQLGDGTVTYHSAPVWVDSLSNVSAITTGDESTCALTVNGVVKCWGWNGSGQLGDGTTISSTVPITVSGLTTDAVSLAAGHSHVCAVTSEGAAKCWGSNAYGQLGNGTTSLHPIPVKVSQPISGVISLKAGYAHMCALSSNGAVKCWGWNTQGQLGDGTRSDRFVPTQVVNLNNAIAIATGWYHNCAVIATGGAVCWGYSASGEVGNGGNGGYFLTPVAVSGLASSTLNVAAGEYHSCALINTGGVKCWGWNGQGQLGDGTTYFSITPVAVSEVNGATAIVTSNSHTCALISGQVKCWGYNKYGQLGDGTRIDRSVPVVVNGLSGVVAVALGGEHSCALINMGKVKCWGMNDYGQLGTAAPTSSTLPLEVNGLNDVAAIAAGEYHTCALTQAGIVRCWGVNWDGQLGDGTFTSHSTPITVSGLSGVSAITAGGDHTCALLHTGEIQCWGANMNGQLGIDPGWTPVTVLGLGIDHTLYLPQIRHP